MAQSSHTEKTGTVKLSIPSILYEWADPKEGNAVGEVFVTNRKITRKVPYLGRKVQKNQEGKIVSHTDEYEIKLKNGFYRLIIKGSKGYRLPNFLVKTNGLIQFIVPQYRFALEETCNGGVKMLKSFSYDEPYQDQLRKYSKPPYHKIQTEVIVLENPFEMVVRYCSREKKGSTLYYKFAQVYYKDLYIESDIIVLKKGEMLIEAVGLNPSPSNEFRAPIVQISGKVVNPDAMKLIFDLQKSKILDQ